MPVAHGDKAAPTLFNDVDITELRRASVRRPGGQVYGAPLIFQLAMPIDEAPRWGSPRRDAYLRKFWPTETVLAGAIYSIAMRNASFRFDLTGDERLVEHCKQMLAYADFGAGWHQFIIKLSIDLLTQDNGAFFEIIRPARVLAGERSYRAVKKSVDGMPMWHVVTRDGLRSLAGTRYKVVDDPLDTPIGIGHLDSARCTRTGDPEYPVIYLDVANNKHKMSWYQVVVLEDMPSPIVEMHGTQYCAVTRLLRAAQTAKSISVYEYEKVSGSFVRAIHITNIYAQTIRDAITHAEETATGQGLVRYTQPIIASTLDPDSKPMLVTIPLASMPDSYDMDDWLRWYIAKVAMVLGVDYGFLAPLPGAKLGTALQSEVMERQSRGKSSRSFMDVMESKFNTVVLPRGVSLAYKEVDMQEIGERDKARKVRAEMRALRIGSGEIDAEIARQIAADDEDLAREYLEYYGEQDLTPSITEPGRGQ